jgi:hypothetical protein
MTDNQTGPKAASPFAFRECFLMPMPIGRKALNLSEMLQAVREVKGSVLFYHLLQSRLTVRPPEVEYTNDFSRWAGVALQESRLMEKLSAFDPFEFKDLEQVRQALTDLMEEYLWETPYPPFARPGFEFHFCEASTVVRRSEFEASTLEELCQNLEKVGLDAIYYHCFEARWRLGSLNYDDFSFWIEANFDFPGLVEAIRGLDIYFFTLEELQEALLELIGRWCGRGA